MSGCVVTDEWIYVRWIQLHLNDEAPVRMFTEYRQTALFFYKLIIETSSNVYLHWVENLLTQYHQ